MVVHMHYTIKEMQNQLQLDLKASRYIHTLGVQYTTACLAMCYRENIEKAETAGLLHDCAKQLPGEKLLEICEKHNENLSDVERTNLFLLHGKAGAHIAHEKFGIKDIDILNAIRYHTTGRPNMTMLEKMVFVADYIEPNRKDAPNLEFLRQMAFRDLDQTVYLILEQTLEYLKSTNTDIDLNTVVTKNYYYDLLRSKK